jgi:hypothetical protein
MYCECCFSWKTLNMTNRAWAVHYTGQLVEPFLVCEECSKKMSIPTFVCQPLCGTSRASSTKPKAKCISVAKCLGKWFCKKNVVEYNPDHLWD